jgi:NAD-dependent SIR2 family protein deacetylase
MIRQFDLSQFLRNIKVYHNGQIAFFLGAGSSVQAGIPSGSDLVWEFKKEIYCTATGTSFEKFKDLQSSSNRSLLQDYFDAEQSNPKQYDPDEYSHYFEKCYSSSTTREQFIRNLVKNIKPSLGHICLGDLIIIGMVKNIWTTNFDELIEAGIKQLDPAYSFRVLSSANKNSVNISADADFLNIYKLHGDYRYDKIKNTLDEVKSLETVMNSKFEASLMQGGLIILGYSGCDESIMSILERNVLKAEFLPNGLIWLRRKNSELPLRTMKLMEIVSEKNENSGIVDIDGFDEFMYSCYQSSNGNNQQINEHWKIFSNRRLPINFAAPKVDYFIKLNTFESINHPTPISFDSDITSWKELKEITGVSKIIVALYARKVYCFGSLDLISSIFNKHILSEPKEEIIQLKYLYRDRSFYTGMLYDLIKIALLSKNNIKKFGNNKYYNSIKHENMEKNYTSYIVYDGIEVSLEFIKGKYHLSLLLTVYITDKNGNPVSMEAKKLLINYRMSSVWNKAYNEKIREWNRILKTANSDFIDFHYEEFQLRFNHACITYGQVDNSLNFPQRISYQFDEPVITFNINNQNARGINQLKGISNYGPIDFSYSKQNQLRYAIKLSIISPSNDLPRILNHLGKLNNGSRLSKEDGYTPVYNGFESIYKQSLEIPQLNDNKRCLVYEKSKIISKESLANILKEKINFLSLNRQDFSILVIYIPKSFEQFRLGGTDDDFNLHDAIKLYALDKEIKVQFVEEKSLNAYEPCKVMWALSASIYAKDGGVLWRPETLNTDTAFVGIGYALSKERGLTVGCSQLFDAAGTGLRLLLRKIKDPQFIHRNPFMKADEARQMMSILREQYYKSNPISKLNRIVIHKTSFFTLDEIQGFTQALEGIEDIELLQIQEFSPWRGIRYKDIDVRSGVHNYAIKRGTVIQLSDDQYLLWTHGCVVNEELWDGSGKNYYKGGRGIPMPLMVKRFYGKATGDTLTKEILMLTKMNWNSGDSLYKHLPVTLDFAKVLSRMSKQNEALYDKLYDFRYFM